MPSLDKVHPDLLTKINKVMSAMSTLGFPMRICQGVRTTEQQQALFAQGRTTPGLIVTKADGVRTKSNHQLKDDGFGHAVDCCFTTGEPFGEKQPWPLYCLMVDTIGLKSGVHFPSPDRPHAEL